MEATIEIVLESLHDDLLQAARYVSGYIDVDDVYQIGVLAILERSKTEPEFLNQKRSYIIHNAVWAMKNWLEKQFFRTKMNLTLDNPSDGDENPTFAGKSLEKNIDIDNGNCYGVLDLSSINVEETVSNREDIEFITARLSTQEKEIVSMIFLGYTQQEISEKFGVSKQRVSKKIIDLSQKFSFVKA